MDRNLERLSFFVSQILRRRWACLAIAWALFLPGFALALLWPDSYESEARIHVQTDGLLGPLLKGLTPETDPDRRVEVMQRTLLARPNLEEVLERTGQARAYPEPAARERAVEMLARKILVRPDRDNLFAVVYRARDPDLARATVQALLDIFVERTIAANRRDMERARRFIDEQIAVQERALEEAERRLAEFQKRNVTYLGGEDGYFQRLQQARTRLVEARTDLEAARARRDELRRQLERVPRTVIPLVGSRDRLGAVGGTAAELARLRSELAQLESRYTERHPRVVGVRRAIETLERQLAEDRGPVGLPNPLYEQMRVQLAAQEAEVASLENRLEKAQRVVDELLALARTVPETEAELKRLTRDYEVIKRNYEELIARREAARIADDLDAGRDRLEFRVVQPATLPVVPAGPPRLAMMAAVFLAAIAGGLAWAMLRAVLDRPFETARALRETLGLPVVAVLGVVPTTGRRIAALLGHTAFAALLLLLVGTFVVVTAVETTVGTVSVRAAVHATVQGFRDA